MRRALTPHFRIALPLAVAAAVLLTPAPAGAVLKTTKPVKVQDRNGDVLVSRLQVDLRHVGGPRPWHIARVTATVRGTKDLGPSRCNLAQHRLILHIGSALHPSTLVKGTCPTGTDDDTRREFWSHTYEPRRLLVADTTLIWSDWSHLRDYSNKSHTDRRAPKVFAMDTRTPGPGVPR